MSGKYAGVAARSGVVEEFVTRFAAAGWPSRRALVESTIGAAAAAPFRASNGNDAMPSRNGLRNLLPNKSANQEELIGAVVAALIRDVGAEAVTGTDQALVYAMSADPDHQMAACDWFLQAGKTWALHGFLQPDRQTPGFSCLTH